MKVSKSLQDAILTFIVRKNMVDDLIKMMSPNAGNVVIINVEKVDGEVEAEAGGSEDENESVSSGESKY